MRLYAPFCATAPGYFALCVQNYVSCRLTLPSSTPYVVGPIRHICDGRTCARVVVSGHVPRPARGAREYVCAGWRLKWSAIDAMGWDRNRNR